MAIQFSTTMRNLFIGRALLAGFVSPCSISVFSGAQPTAATITANWGAYASTNSNFLAHYTAGGWSQPSNGIMMQLSTMPPTQVALNSGTASWAILWTTAVTAVNVAAGTLPSTSFMVVPCSDSVGSGVIRFADPVFVGGVSKVILDGSVGAV